MNRLHLIRKRLSCQPSLATLTFFLDSKKIERFSYARRVLVCGPCLLGPRFVHPRHTCREHVPEVADVSEGFVLDKGVLPGLRDPENPADIIYPAELQESEDLVVKLFSVRLPIGLFGQPFFHACEVEGRVLGRQGEKDEIPKHGEVADFGFARHDNHLGCSEPTVYNQQIASHVNPSWLH